MKAGRNGLTNVTCFLTWRLGFDAVDGLLKLSWWVWGGADFFPCFFHVFAFSNSYIQSSQRRLGREAPTATQSAHGELPPTYPHKVYRLVCSHPENYFEHGVIG